MRRLKKPKQPAKNTQFHDLHEFKEAHIGIKFDNFTHRSIYEKSM
jgi:hypothetical protein